MNLMNVNQTTLFKNLSYYIRYSGNSKQAIEMNTFTSQSCDSAAYASFSLELDVSKQTGDSVWKMKCCTCLHHPYDTISCKKVSRALYACNGHSIISYIFVICLPKIKNTVIHKAK